MKREYKSCMPIGFAIGFCYLFLANIQSLSSEMNFSLLLSQTSCSSKSPLDFKTPNCF